MIISNLIQKFPATALFIASFAVVFLFIPVQESKAIPVIPPFGGPIASVFYCLCSGNILLFIGPPIGGTYIYQPGASITFPFGQVYRPGAESLGLFAPGAGVCLVPTPFGCPPIPSVGLITQIGTSI